MIIQIYEAINDITENDMKIAYMKNKVNLNDEKEILYST